MQGATHKHEHTRATAVLLMGGPTRNCPRSSMICSVCRKPARMAGGSTDVALCVDNKRNGKSCLRQGTRQGC